MFDEILDLMQVGIFGMIGIGFMGAVTTLILHFLGQRSQQHMAETSQTNLNNLHSLGIQAIIGANEMKIVDKSLENNNK